MKKIKISKIISIICGIIGLIVSVFGLIIGLESIGADGLDVIGVIFIMPSIVAFIIILVDFLITLGKIKKGLIYSWINSIIKIGIILCFIPITIDDYMYEMKYGASNLTFDLIVIILLTIITIPSITNIIKLKKK